MVNMEYSNSSLWYSLSSFKQKPSNNHKWCLSSLKTSDYIDQYSRTKLTRRCKQGFKLTLSISRETLLHLSIRSGLYNSRINQHWTTFFCQVCQSNVQRLFPASDYVVWTALSALIWFDYCMLGSSQKLEGAIEYLIIGNEKSICWLEIWIVELECY